MWCGGRQGWWAEVAGCQKEDALRLGGTRCATYVYLEAELTEVAPDQVFSCLCFVARFKGERAIIYRKHAEEFEEIALGEVAAWVAGDATAGMR